MLAARWLLGYWCVLLVRSPFLLDWQILFFQHSGGDPDASMERARVILADPNTEVFQHLIKTYQNTPGKHIESYLWVKKCIEKAALVFTPVVYKNPGGRRPGEEYVAPYDTIPAKLCIIAHSGARNSQKKTRSTYANGLPRRYHIKRREAEPAIDYTSSCVNK